MSQMKNSNPTRRDFLTRTAGALAAPMILPAIAFGRSGRPAPSERVTLGHIGVGGRGSDLLRSFLALPQAQCVAASDCFASRRAEAKRVIDERYGTKDCTMHADFRELLARDDVDAVVIATPDHWHVPIATAAIRAGKDVYVEKPLGLAVAWNRMLRETVQRYGAVFQYGTQQRSGRNFRFACELARNGYLGALERIEAWCPGMAAPGGYESTSKGGGSTVEIPVPEDLDYEMWLGPAVSSPYTADRCTCWGAYHVYDNALGFIAGWGAHPLDIAQWGNGTDDTAPVLVEGKGEVATEGIFDTIRSWDVRAAWANGVTLRFMNQRTAEPVVSEYRTFHDHGTTFFGPEGWVSVDRGGIHASDEKLLKTKLRADDVHLYESDHHQANFLDCVRTRRATVSTVEAAFQSDLISQLSDISIRMQKPMRWDPQAERIVDDELAERRLNRPLRGAWRL